MYVCICIPTKEKEFVQALNENSNCFKSALKQTCMGTQCGKCMSHAKALHQQNDAELKKAP